MRLPARITEALSATGRPWEVVQGSRHLQLRVEGRLVACLHRGSRQSGDPREVRNVVAQIRRAAR